MKQNSFSVQVGGEAKKAGPKKTVPQGNLGTIFHQDWMMEAGTKGNWAKVEIRQEGKVIASLPYVLTHRFGTKTVGMPYYAHVLGPVLQLPPSKPSRQLENATSLIGQLVALLPPHDRFNQILPPEDNCSVAFSLASFTVEANYTFRINPDQTPEKALQSMKGTQRRNIASTFDRLSIEQHRDLDKFVSIANEQVKDQVSRYRFDLIEAIVTAAIARDQVMFISAYDQSGRNMATTILLYDTKVVYFWLTARLMVPGNRAYARLIWEAYQFAHARGLTLDMDGYASQNGARYLADFGGEPISRNRVTHKNIRFRALQLMNDWYVKPRRFISSVREGTRD